MNRSWVKWTQNQKSKIDSIIHTECGIRAAVKSKATFLYKYWLKFFLIKNKHINNTENILSSCCTQNTPNCDRSITQPRDICNLNRFGDFGQPTGQSIKISIYYTPWAPPVRIPHIENIAPVCECVWVYTSIAHYRDRQADRNPPRCVSHPPVVDIKRG